MMKAPQNFSADDLPRCQRARAQDLESAAAVFVGKGAHRDGRDQEDEDPGREAEEVFERGIAVLENIVAENKKHEPVHEQEHHDGNDAGEAAEELAKLFFTDGPHRL
jgi:sugar phosphate isomerase/epimerase